MSANPPARDTLPTPAEQRATYERQRSAYDRLLSLWIQGGKQGPPPPLPVRPHTPGWKP